jgi:hypothetical protein
MQLYAMYRQKHLIITGMVREYLVHVVSVGVFLIARCCDTRKTLYFAFHEDGVLARTRTGFCILFMIFGGFMCLYMYSNYL